MPYELLNFLKNKFLNLKKAFYYQWKKNSEKWFKKLLYTEEGDKKNK